MSTARTRVISPDFFRNEHLVSLPMDARLMAAGLVCWADRAGRLKDRPVRLQMEMFPADPAIDVNNLLNKMQAVGYLKRYEVDGSRYIQLNSFAKHQNPHYREVESTIPQPSTNVDSTLNQTRTDVAPTSLLEQEQEQEQEQGQEQKATSVPKAIKAMMGTAKLDKEAKQILMDGFDRWWSLYPKKKSKKRCKQIWMRIKPDFEYLIADMENRLKKDKAFQDPQFVMYPEKFLNGERWSDEIEPIGKQHVSELNDWYPPDALVKEMQDRYGFDAVNLCNADYPDEANYRKHVKLMASTLL